MRFLAKFKIVFIVIAVILLVGTAAFLVWASNPLGPMPEAELALTSDDQITVETDPWLTFYPTAAEPDTGFILYPGGRVDETSYAPTARAIAGENYLVVIPPMPLDLAVFDIDAAVDVIAAHDEISTWVIGGHSLGGAMAASYVHDNPGAMDGLLLWASYPADGSSVADQIDLAAASIYGTEDGAADKLAASAALLPPGTVWTVIEGGNHAQFGWYGLQSGDGEASISREDQQAQIIEATVDFLASLTPDG